MSKLRTIAAWAVGIVTFAVVEVAGSFIGGRIGVPAILDVEPYIVQYGRGADSEVSSEVTSFGWGVLVLAILAAVVMWHRVQQEQLGPEGRAQAGGFLLGGGACVIGGAALWKMFDGAHGWAVAVHNVLELGLCAAALGCAIKFYNHLRDAARSVRN